MPPDPVSISELFDIFEQRLELSWVTGQDKADRPLFPAGSSQDTPPVGHLNLIHPHRIQVLGRAELDYLAALGKNSLNDALNQVCCDQTAMAVVSDGLEVPEDMRSRAQRCDITLLTTPQPGNRIIEHLTYFLQQLLADTVTVHGVLMDVLGLGVLLTGGAGVGKSELALELITRGHALVADDAPEFRRIAPDTLRGTCPDVLQDFMEVRGLGMLNIRAMFGDSAVKDSKTLRLVIHLAHLDNVEHHQVDRLDGSRLTRTILDVAVVEIGLPVAPGRDLAVLVEAAARDHILREHGYNATADFIERQRQFLEQER